METAQPEEQAPIISLEKDSIPDQPDKKEERGVKQKLSEIGEKLDKKVYEILKSPETKLALSNMALFTMELYRDFSHYQSGEVGGLGQGIPLKTEGLAGLIDLHVGSSAEAIEVMYLARPVVALVSKGVEIITDKKVSADIQVGTSVLIGALVPSLIELGIIEVAGNHVADPMDIFGPLVAAAWALSSWKIINSETLKKVFSSDSDELKLMLSGLWASVSEQVIEKLFDPIIERLQPLTPARDKIRKLFYPTESVNPAIAPTENNSPGPDPNT